MSKLPLLITGEHILDHDHCHKIYYKDARNGLQYEIADCGGIARDLTGTEVAAELVKRANSYEALKASLEQAVFALESVFHLTGNKELLPYIEQVKAALPDGGNPNLLTPEKSFTKVTFPC